MNKKVLHTLEYFKIIEMLVNEADSPLAKETAGKLLPSSRRNEIIAWQTETSHALMRLLKQGKLSFHGLRDIRPSLLPLEKGGTLGMGELLNICRCLEIAGAAIAYNEKFEDLQDALSGRFAALVDLPDLRREITRCILSPEEMADDASAELKRIRRTIKGANDRIREQLTATINRSGNMLRDNLVTMRNGRYCLPVKQEYKSTFQGMIHDQSSTGSTFFIEPMAIVKLNNELAELAMKEQEEIEKILASLSALTAPYAEDIQRDILLLAELDFIFAKAALSKKMQGSEPLFDKDYIHIKKGRHPLIPKEQVVPIDVTLGKTYDLLIITGPNTGGKTVLLKTTGLLTAMAMCGLLIPAGDGSSVSVFKNILVDIGDRQSIENNLSTFSSHISSIVEILNEADSESLVLFDELGSGTDPVEGAALAVAIIEELVGRGSRLLATTHYQELKLFAIEREGIENASCEFDVETLRPTYHLLVGIPGKSNAFAISRRLGLPEDIIEDAKARVGTESASFEDVLTKLDTLRQSMEREKVDIDKAQQKTEADRKEAARLRAELSVRLEMSNEKARREAEKIIADAREEAERAFKEIDRMRAVIQEQYDHQQINAERAELRRRLNEAEEKQQSQKQKELADRKSARPIQVGDVVEIKAMGMKAEVEEVSADRVLTLKAGLMHITAREDEVFLLEHQKKKEAPKSRGTGTSQLRTAAVPAEIDIRGMETLEAIPIVERYIDDAYLGRLESVRIIHGKGTGALRQTVHDTLRRHKRVKGFRLGRYGEGETGVTVVELK